MSTRIELLPFPCKSCDKLGCLSFFEHPTHLPFPIQRIYFIDNVPAGAERGFHAHKNLSQFIVCLSGSVEFITETFGNRQIHHLSRQATSGLLVEGLVWREMRNFSQDCILLVCASERYIESDYIRDYDEFIKHQKNNQYPKKEQS